jgi:hypothetical protein
MIQFLAVTFDRRPLLSYKGLHEDFIDHPEIHAWWHWVKSIYIVRTSLTANQLSAHFEEVARANGIPATHLVVRVDLGDRQGRLPREAWEWIRRNAGD